MEAFFPGLILKGFMKHLFILSLFLVVTLNAFPITKKNIVEPYTKMPFVFIEGGCFQMGDVFDHQYLRSPFISREKIHKVCLSGFYLGQYEVTVAQWNSVMVEGAAVQNTMDLNGYYPITNISWADIERFLGKLNEYHHSSGHMFRLPSEAEWEYACREKGKMVEFGNGKNVPSEREMNCQDPQKNNDNKNNHQLMPVGQYISNSLGLYDMAGNAGERVLESLHEYPDDSSTIIKNPEWDLNGNKPLNRGGSYRHSFEACDCTCRHWTDCSNTKGKNAKSKHIGFRLVMEIVDIE